MAVILFSESRLPGSDGAYTDQKIFLVEAGTLAAFVALAHDLGRTPDWVRVTQLANLDPDTGAPLAVQGYVLPAVSDVLVDGRFVWLVNDGVDPVDIDTAEELYFAAGNAGQNDALLMVEFGITHSAAK